MTITRFRPTKREAERYAGLMRWCEMTHVKVVPDGGGWRAMSRGSELQLGEFASIEAHREAKAANK